MGKKGILLCGHGTRVKYGVTAFNKFAEDFQKQLDGYETTAAFLEMSEPNFDTGIKTLIDKGVTEIIALPLFLFTGIHIQKDIPGMLYKAMKKYDITIKMGNYMGVCKEMVDICEHLIQESATAEILENPQETALVVAGVGSSKIQANADLSALTRLVQERFHFNFTTIGFLSRMTFPPLADTMQNVGLLPYKNIIVLPYFFFTGVYMKRAEVEVTRARKRNPEKNFICTDLLASHQGLYDLLKARLQEVLDGRVDVIGAMDKDELENYDGHEHHHGKGHGHHHHHHKEGHQHNHKKCTHKH